LAKVSTKAFVNLKKFVANVPSSVDQRVSNLIALSVRQRMLAFIARGISPILGNGRFPGYKHAASRDASKYPFNVRKDYPAKRPRPVNLFLSGDFLRDLIARKVPGKKLSIEIGFKQGSLSAKKESGHREGVNGQPRRPIIPSESEEFNVTIKQIMVKMMKDAVRAAVKRGA
jgi:hypothetical protein